MIDKKKKILFIHIPKCAGTFISKNLTPDVVWDHRNGQHDTLLKATKRYANENWNQYFIFSIVRNPFDRFGSFFHFHKRKGFKLFKEPSWVFNSPKAEDYMLSPEALIKNIEGSPNKLKDWAKNDLLSCTDYLKNDLGLAPQVFRLEEMDDWIPELERLTGSKFSMERVNTRGKKTDYTLELNEFEKDFVKREYRDDLKNYYPELLS